VLLLEVEFGFVLPFERTGLAAMVTIYGARSTVEAMIARIRRMHDAIVGTTPSGEAYYAMTPNFASWRPKFAVMQHSPYADADVVLCGYQAG
jgi:uncharacterized protein (DUF2236 family)